MEATMPMYDVIGVRDGNDFKAPTQAESRTEAVHKFLREVDRDEFTVTEVR